MQFALKLGCHSDCVPMPAGTFSASNIATLDFFNTHTHTKQFLLFQHKPDPQRHFQGGSARGMEGYPKGFRGFPGVSIRDTLESRMLIIWEFRCFVAWPKHQNPGEQAPFIMEQRHMLKTPVPGSPSPACSITCPHVRTPIPPPLPNQGSNW